MSSTKQRGKRRKGARKTRGSEQSKLAPTLGPYICAFIEQNLVHSEGDWYGQPFELLPWQEAIIYQAYELNEDGSRRWDQVLLGMPKGNGKTELVAAVACAELAGDVVFTGWERKGVPSEPCPRLSPDIPIAAASHEQANTLFSAAKAMISQGKLRPFYECFDTEIVPRQGPGRLYRVAAAAGTNDGRRPTLFVADELHEWLGNKERVHLVLSNNRAKRADAWEFNISTAGADMQSKLGRLYSACRNGERPRTLFIWFEPSGECDLSKKTQLRKALKEANPAVGRFLDIETLMARRSEMPEHEFRRYHLNQWVNAPDTWDVADVWDELMAPKGITGPISLGFDGAYSRDSIALVGCTQDGHLFVVDCWERPEGVTDWHVDTEEVTDAILAAFARYQVEILGYDEMFGRIWSVVMENLESKGCNIVEWPTRSPDRFREGCAKFRSAVLDRRISHDGDDRLRAHVYNARYASDGIRIVKEHKDSTKHIDLGVASVIAYDLATADRTQWALV